MMVRGRPVLCYGPLSYTCAIYIPNTKHASHTHFINKKTTYILLSLLSPYSITLIPNILCGVIPVTLFGQLVYRTVKVYHTKLYEV